MPRLEMRPGAHKRIDELLDHIHNLTHQWPDPERYAFYIELTKRFGKDMRTLQYQLHEKDPTQ